VELLSIYKRLKAFELAIANQPLPSIEQVPDLKAPEASSAN
jgi:peptide/bleomycin uptake transporter